MISYGRTSNDVVRWPDDPAARKALEEYFQTLSQDSMAQLDGGDLNFTGADLSGLALSGAEFGEAELSGVRLVGADLFGAWMMGATLRGADLTRCWLRKSKGRGCDAEDAVFCETDLRSAEFEDSNLCRADLRKSLLAGARLWRIDLRDADLRECTFGGDKGWTSLNNARMAGCRLEGATGSVTGPVDVGADSPRLLDGDDLQRWFADRGARDVQVKQPVTP